jgi:hypothetical protein
MEIKVLKTFWLTISNKMEDKQEDELYQRFGTGPDN